jgi:hypothetical protein
MPFLFVDYDQGAGGEYFCAKLSRSFQCRELGSITFQNARTKIIDLFGQEFLKTVPQPKYLEAHPTLFDLVPAHRTSILAKELLGNISSIRIANPSDEDLWQYLKHQQITKTKLSPMPTDAHLIGEVNMLMRSSSNNDWVRHVRKNMDGLSLILLSKGIEPTEANKKDYIEQLVSFKEPEPDFEYDLIIPYEDLFYNTEQIKINLKNIFNISINDNWLDKYKQDYDAYCAKT